MERTDMLETIRQLTRQMKLKDLIIANFIPEESAHGLEKRASWNQEEDCWIVQVSCWQLAHRIEL
jgi:kinesin family protein 3/17